MCHEQFELWVMLSSAREMVVPRERPCGGGSAILLIKRKEGNGKGQKIVIFRGGFDNHDSQRMEGKGSREKRNPFRGHIHHWLSCAT